MQSTFWKDLGVASLIMAIFLTVHTMDFTEIKPAKAEPTKVTPAEELSPSVPLLQFDEDELQCLRNVIYGEARGEPIMTQIAVAATVLNRSYHVDWPSNLCSVIKQKNQFHGYRETIRLNNRIDVESWDLARDVALYVTHNYGSLPEGLYSAYYFRSDGVAWRHLTVVADLGGMVFYG